MKNTDKVLEDVTRVSIQFLLREAFYGHFFTGLVKKVSESLDTLAVAYHNKLTTLYINPSFWDNELKTKDLKYGVLKHEILHIVFKHIFRFEDFKDKAIFNVAADLVVNQYVENYQLPEGAVLLESFPELKLEAHQDAKYYYDKLISLQEKCSKNEGENKDNQSWKNLKSMLEQANQNQAKHSLWKTFEELSSAEKDIVEATLNQALENTLQRLKPEQFGNLPAGLQDYLKNFEQSLKPVVNWRRVLRLFANSSSRTRIKNTLRRPSKRYGTNPGIRIKKNQKVLVALDTSGSVSNDEVGEFFGEIYHIWKQGAEVLVVECDTAIHKTYLYKGVAPESIKGRGGTAFDAPIAYANEVYIPDALIYFTDGYASVPSVRSIAPILWLISTNGVDIGSLKGFQGRKVKMS